MSNPGPRERAETAFGHLQNAVSEMIAAAHDALDLLDGVVSTANLGEVLETVTHLSHSFVKQPGTKPGPKGAPKSGPAPRPDSPVQRISVR